MGAGTSLEESPLHKVLLTCFATKRSGLLVVQDDKRKKVIVLDKGKPTGCRSNIRHETLGFYVIDRKLIDQKTLDEVLTECKENDGFPLGGALVRRQLISPDKLAELLEEQLINRINDLFTWKTGTIKLQPSKPGMIEDAVPLRITTPSLILGAALFMGEQGGHIKKIDTTKKVVPCENGHITFEDFSLPGPEVGLLRSIDGTKTVADLLATNRVDQERARQLVFGFEYLGLVRFEENKQPVSAAQPLVTKAAAAKSATPARPKSSDPLAKRIDDLLSAAKEQDYFELLGVSRDAEDSEVRKVYFLLAKEFHPDRLRSLDEHSRGQGEMLFAKISEAYNTILDPKKREEYLENLAFGGDDATEQAGKILESEVLFQKARGILKQGDFRTANKLMNQAIELYPDEPEYYLYQGWSLYRIGVASNNPGDIQRGKGLIEKYKDDRPKIEVGYLFLGQIAKTEEKLDVARNMFNKALDINKDCHDAERELRLMDMRENKKDSKGRGLFGRKK